MSLLDEIFDHEEDLHLAVPKKKRYIRCKLCNWKILAWTTTKKGKRVNGYSKLQDHMMIQHETQYQKILERIEVI